MKTTLTVLFTSWMALVGFAQGEDYRSLNGYRDTVEIPAGQTALVITATNEVVLGIEKKGERPQQFRFAAAHRDCVCQGSSRRSRKNVFPAPSREKPVYIPGPVTLTLWSKGFVTLVVPEERRRSTSSSTSAARRFVSN